MIENQALIETMSYVLAYLVVSGFILLIVTKD